MRPLLVVLVLVGCRSFPAPSVASPPLPPDPSVEIKSTTANVRTGSQDICDGVSRCRTEDVTREEKRSQILLGAKPITYGELRLIDPEGGAAYAKQLAEYGERAKPCRAARKYKIAGILTTVVGGVVVLIDGAPTAVRIGGAVVAAAGIATIVVGSRKGKGCDDVYAFYRDHQLHLAETETVIDRDEELKTIAARFNAQHGGAPAAP